MLNDISTLISYLMPKRSVNPVESLQRGQFNEYNTKSASNVRKTPVITITQWFTLTKCNSSCLSPNIWFKEKLFDYLTLSKQMIDIVSVT